MGLFRGFRGFRGFLGAYGGFGGVGGFLVEFLGFWALWFWELGLAVSRFGGLERQGLGLRFWAIMEIVGERRVVAGPPGF